AGLSAGVDVTQHAWGFAQLAKDIDIKVGEVSARLLTQRRPVAAFRQFHGALVGHLQKEQVCDLLDVVTVINTVMAQRVAEAPQFLNNVSHAAIASFNSSMSSSSLP